MGPWLKNSNASTNLSLEIISEIKNDWVRFIVRNMLLVDAKVIDFQSRSILAPGRKLKALKLENELRASTRECLNRLL